MNCCGSRRILRWSFCGFFRWWHSWATGRVIQALGCSSGSRRRHQTPTIDFAHFIAVLTVSQNHFDHVLTRLLLCLVAANFLTLFGRSLEVPPPVVIFEKTEAFGTVLFTRQRISGNQSWELGWSIGGLRSWFVGWVWCWIMSRCSSWMDVGEQVGVVIVGTKVGWSIRVLVGFGVGLVVFLLVGVAVGM